LEMTEVAQRDECSACNTLIDRLDTTCWNLDKYDS